MIARRAAIAAERGCVIVSASAITGGVSATNLAALGFEALVEEALYPFDPAA
jgi:hypothetical protein